MDASMLPASALESEMTAELAALKPSRARLITVTPIPRFIAALTPYQPLECLTLATPYSNCVLAPHAIIPQTELAAEHFEAGLGRTRLADVTSMFCTSTKCPIVTYDRSVYHLIYNNGTHINSTYSTWINVAFGQVLAPQLP
jgi:hypothetical protein